jgi:hypothetical protein
MDFFTYATVLVAALILAVDTGIRQSSDLSARAPAFMKGPIWGFAPLFLMVLAGLIWMVRAADYRFASIQTQVPQQVAESASTAPLDTPAQEAEAESSPKSTPTPTIKIDPELKRLLEMFHGRTELQAQAFVKPKLGTKTTVTGKINEIYTADADTGSVSFEDRFPPFLRVYMYFNKSWTQRLSALRQGDTITVKGRIFRIDENEIALDDCQITEIANEK